MICAWAGVCGGIVRTAGAKEEESRRACGDQPDYVANDSRINEVETVVMEVLLCKDGNRGSTAGMWR